MHAFGTCIRFNRDRMPFNIHVFQCATKGRERVFGREGGGLVGRGGGGRGEGGGGFPLADDDCSPSPKVGSMVQASEGSRHLLVVVAVCRETAC